MTSDRNTEKAEKTQKIFAAIATIDAAQANNCNPSDGAEEPAAER
jgi:hypothetical protein